MNVEELREYCLSIKGASESLPFDDTSLVLKVANKMFALIPLEADRLSIALKCDPIQAIELREQYECVEPAWHFNKKYWNTIFLNNDMNDSEVKCWINHSVSEVIATLSKKAQNEYFSL